MMKKILFLILFLSILILGGGFLLFQNSDFIYNFTKSNKYSISQESSETILKVKVADNSLEDKEISDDKEEKKEEEKKPFPEKFKLEVPFISQAPAIYGEKHNQPKWDDDHNEACEEAAIIIAHYFLTGKELTPEIADGQILAMLDFQEKNYGERNKDLEAEETAKLIKDFYGCKNVEVKYDISIEDIKKEINAGKAVILPAAGRLLFGPLKDGKNPYYRDPGPFYHMVVAIGWDDDKGEMIVNDPGTRNGESFSFGYDVLDSALHEWNSGEVLEGRKAMIIINEL